MPIAVAVHVGQARQILLRVHAIPQRLAAVLLVVGGKERLAVSRAAAIVDAEDDVAVVDEVLDHRAVTGRGLSARAAMHPHDRRRLARGVAWCGFHRMFGIVHPVARLEADDLRYRRDRCGSISGFSALVSFTGLSEPIFSEYRSFGERSAFEIERQLRLAPREVHARPRRPTGATAAPTACRCVVSVTLDRRACRLR